MGAVGSYRAGDPNREFGFLQAMITTPGVTLRAAQEVDLYRGMRLDAGEQPLSFTSSYALVSFHPRGPLRVDAGFDNRRTVRLYRDVTDPVTAFDDRYRQGAWGGASVITSYSIHYTKLYEHEPPVSRRAFSACIPTRCQKWS